MSVKRTFASADYAVFAVMLVISAAIGIFYAIRDRKSTSGTTGYFLANRSMSIVPVAMSLIVSFSSSLSLLGLPAEVYHYGTMILWVNMIFIPMSIIVAELYIPTFYRLGISSTYEYLELRFNRTARLFGTLAFIVATIFYMGVVMYGPALAFAAVTDFEIWPLILITGLVCTLYTTLGGLRGVIWTDVFQALVICGGTLAVLIKGSMIHGGMANIWRIAEKGGRIDFVHFENDVRIRNTVWSIVIGGTIRWVGMYGASQSQVQRYLCCKTERNAIRSLYLNLLGLIIVMSLSILCGLVIYAQYHDCDPLQRKCLEKGDQLLPYMVLDIFQDYPGAAGLIVSSVFAGSLSSISSGINAIGTVVLEDMIRPISNFNETTYTWISKGVVVLFGLLSIGMAFLLSTVKELLQATFSLMGLMMGPLVGMFTLAMQFPFANSIGSICGLLSGVGVGTWFYLGRKPIKMSNSLLRRLPLNADKCPGTCFETANSTGSPFNTSTIPDLFMANFTQYDSVTHTENPLLTTKPFNNATVSSESEIFQDDTPFYTLSYHYISALGLCATLLVGIVVSLATCGWQKRKEVDPRLLRPMFDHWLFRCWIPEKVRKVLRFGVDWEDNPPKEKEEVHTEGLHFENLQEESEK